LLSIYRGGSNSKKNPLLAGKTSALRAAPHRAATLRGAETGVPPPARGGETRMSTRKVPPDGLLVGGPVVGSALHIRRNCTASKTHAVELTRVARAGWPAPRRVRYRVATAFAPPQLPCGGRTSCGGLEAHAEPQLKLSQAQFATSSYALALALQPSRLHALAIAFALQPVRLQAGL
jgi:hypothetical protein